MTLSPLLAHLTQLTQTESPSLLLSQSQIIHVTAVLASPQIDIPLQLLEEGD